MTKKIDTDKAGPMRRAPQFYAGETYGRHDIQHKDVERHPNGAVVGIRNKHMRRLIRGALKRRYSKYDRSLKLARAMQAQAREIIADQHPKKSRHAKARLAKRLYEMELAIHTPRPNAPTRAERRAQASLLKKNPISEIVDMDAISQVVDSGRWPPAMMAAKKP
jgi:hypothetical protein